MAASRVGLLKMEYWLITTWAQTDNSTRGGRTAAPSEYDVTVNFILRNDYTNNIFEKYGIFKRIFTSILRLTLLYILGNLAVTNHSTRCF